MERRAYDVDPFLSPHGQQLRSLQPLSSTEAQNGSLIFRPKYVISRMKTIFSQGGLVCLIVAFVKKALSPVVVFGGLRFYCCELHKSVAGQRVTVHSSNATIKQGCLSDLDNIFRAYDFSRPLSVLTERLRNNALCFLAVDSDGNGVNCRWCKVAGSELIPEIGMRIVLGPREAYIFDVHTRSDFRGRGIDSVAADFTVNALASAGFCRYYLYVRSDNPVGKKAMSRNAESIGRVWYIHFRRFKPLVIGKAKLNGPVFIQEGGDSR